MLAEIFAMTDARPPDNPTSQWTTRSPQQTGQGSDNSEIQSLYRMEED